MSLITARLGRNPGAGSPLGPTDVKPTIYRVLLAISLVHLLNDSMQSVFPAILPILQQSMNLSYFQVGLVTFALNMTSSVMQPVVGMVTDRKPYPLLLPLGMVASAIGMLLLAVSNSYALVIASVILVGLGSAVFHPEASRVANMAAGSRRGLAQSIFQVGGNTGQSLGPVMTALIFVQAQQMGAIWFTLVAGLAVVVQAYVARWYSGYLVAHPRPVRSGRAIGEQPERKRAIGYAICLLVFLVFARSWYNASISNYYAFYLIERFGMDVKMAQWYIFCFLGFGALGTFFGGPLADRFGRKRIIFFSMLGVAPFALLLPYVDAVWAFPILAVSGFILMSSFSVTVVYAQELVPGKIGTVSGLITGLAFGMGAIGSVALGSLADWAGIEFVMKLCSLLPLIGLLTFFLPSDAKLKQWSGE